MVWEKNSYAIFAKKVEFYPKITDKIRFRYFFDLKNELSRKKLAQNRYFLVKQHPSGKNAPIILKSKWQTNSKNIFCQFVIKHDMGRFSAKIAEKKTAKALPNGILGRKRMRL